MDNKDTNHKKKKYYNSHKKYNNYNKTNMKHNKATKEKKQSSKLDEQNSIINQDNLEFQKEVIMEDNDNEIINNNDEDIQNIPSNDFDSYEYPTIELKTIEEEIVQSSESDSYEYPTPDFSTTEETYIESNNDTYDIPTIDFNTPEEELVSSTETINETTLVDDYNIQLENDDSISTNIENDIKIENNNKKRNNIYIGFTARLFIYLFSTILLVILANFIIGNNIKFTNEKSINYTEQSNLDYKVYLKPNSFYDKEYLDKGMSYVAGLIDKINIDFVYDFNSDSNIDVDFNYDIVGILDIKDEMGNNTYFTKEYTLLKSKNYQLKDNKTYNLKETIKIDYEYYNNLANSFKSTYGVNTQSNLNVYLRLNKSTTNSNLSMENTGNMYVTIPLSQKAINIGLEYKDINESHNIVDKRKVKINNYLQVIISITLYIIALLLLIKFVKLVSKIGGKPNKFDKYVEKILFQYDRLIIESNETLDLKKYNVIPIKQFKELLDARDNLKAPIMYKPLIKHQKCYFYIKKHEDLYLLIVKEVDIENGILK